MTNLLEVDECSSTVTAIWINLRSENSVKQLILYSNNGYLWSWFWCALIIYLGSGRGCNLLDIPVHFYSPSNGPL